MNLESYSSLRSKALKRIMRQLREEAGYSQEAVARLLGCARTRITEIERVESTSGYSIAEIELLTTLFGKHPHDILSVTGQHAIELGRLVTEMQTSLALQGVVDCVLPKRIEKLYAKRIEQPYGDKEYFPGKYETPYGWKMAYKQRFGLANVVSGRAVMLNDLYRLRDGDNQFGAHLSPRGDAVAYWVYPYDGEPRLSIQYIDAAPCESKDYLCLINWLGSENLVNKNRACFDLNTSLFHEKQLFVNEMV